MKTNNPERGETYREPGYAFQPVFRTVWLLTQGGGAEKYIRTLPFFQSIPLVLEEAALVDGATRLRAVFYVILPLALPGIIATGIFTFILAWNDYIFVRILITSDNLKTLSVGIADLYNATVIDWGMIMSGGMLITIPVLVFFIFIQRYLIAGWGAGAVKG